MKRRFEFVAGSSAKFWEVGQAGKEVTIRYGRLGTHGQSQCKSFSDAAAAERHIAKRIGEKTGKGYRKTVAA